MIDNLLQYLIEYRYWALFVAALLEGPVVVFLAGSLVALGVFDLFTTLGVLVFRDLFMDTMFYGVGRMARFPFFAKRVAALRRGTGLAARVLEGVESGWRDHPVRLMWIGKLAYGLSAYFIISAGVAGLPFRKFWLYTLPVSLFQFGVLMSLGYLLGGTMWQETSKAMTVFQVLIASVTVFLLVRWLTRLVRKKTIDQQ